MTEKRNYNAKIYARMPSEGNLDALLRNNRVDSRTAETCHTELAT